MGEIWLDTFDIGDCNIPVGSSGDPLLDSTDIGSFTSLTATGNVLIGSTVIGTYIATYTFPLTPEEDPRYRTKVFLETYIDNQYLTKDDDTTQVVWAVIFAYPDYGVEREFRAATDPVDLLFVIDKPTSELKLGVRYTEQVPVYIYCIDKAGITGTKLAWKAEVMLRKICEDQPHGSFRDVERIEDNETRLGTTTLYSSTLMLHYRRTSARGKA